MKFMEKYLFLTKIFILMVWTLMCSEITDKYMYVCDIDILTFCVTILLRIRALYY